MIYNNSGSVFSGIARVGNLSVREAAAGTMIVDGAISASKISVNNLSAVSATIGTLRTASSGARTEIKDNIIKVFDTNNVLRVKIGDLSL
jgi:hypothetical protein